MQRLIVKIEVQDDGDETRYLPVIHDSIQSFKAEVEQKILTHIKEENDFIPGYTRLFEDLRKIHPSLKGKINPKYQAARNQIQKYSKDNMPTHGMEVGGQTFIFSDFMHYDSVKNSFKDEVRWPQIITVDEFFASVEEKLKTS